MKSKNIATTFLLSVTMFIASCGSNTSENKTENTVTQQTENTIYQCPMKCEGEKTYTKPGACPVCNMDLEKVEGIHEHHKQDSAKANH